MAIADLAQHLHVEQRALLEALRLQELAPRLEEAQPLPQLFQDARDGALRLVGGRDVVAGGIDARAGDGARGDAAERVERRQLLDGVAPQLHAQRLRLGGGGEDLDHVAPHPKRAPPKIDVVALVLDGHEAPDERVALEGLARLEPHVHALVGLRRADAVDARHGGDHDDVAALEE